MLDTGLGSIFLSLTPSFLLSHTILGVVWYCSSFTTLRSRCGFLYFSLFFFSTPSLVCPTLFFFISHTLVCSSSTPHPRVLDTVVWIRMCVRHRFGFHFSSLPHHPWYGFLYFFVAKPLSPQPREVEFAHSYLSIFSSFPHHPWCVPHFSSFLLHTLVCSSSFNHSSTTS